MAKKWLGYIDCAKFLAIVLLLIEHTGNFIALSNSAYPQIKTYICSFHMPLFFILHGMVASCKPFGSAKQWLQQAARKSSSLLIPYVLWCLIYSGSFDENFFSNILYGTNLSLTQAKTNAVLWFLPAMFTASILFSLTGPFELWLNKRIPKLKVIVIIAEIASSMCISLKLRSISSLQPFGLPFSVDVAFTALAFMLLGRHLIRPLMEKTVCVHKAFILLGAGALCVIGYFSAQLNAPVEPYPVVIMAFGLYGKNYLFFIGIALVATVSLLWLSTVVQNRLFNWLGKGSLLMMAGHYILFPYTLNITTLLSSALQWQSDTLFAIVNALLCTVFFIPIQWLVMRYAPALIGKHSST